MSVRGFGALPSHVSTPRECTYPPRINPFPCQLQNVNTLPSWILYKESPLTSDVLVGRKHNAKRPWQSIRETFLGLHNCGHSTQGSSETRNSGMASVTRMRSFKTAVFESKKFWYDLIYARTRASDAAVFANVEVRNDVLKRMRSSDTEGSGNEDVSYHVVCGHRIPESLKIEISGLMSFERMRFLSTGILECNFVEYTIIGYEFMMRDGVYTRYLISGRMMACTRDICIPDDCQRKTLTKRKRSPWIGCSEIKPTARVWTNHELI